MDNVLARPLVWRIAPMFVSLCILTLYAIGMLWEPLTYSDSDAYWLAAERLLTGEPLYGGTVEGHQVYRYGPWFAYLWVPLTYLPREAVTVAWHGLMVAAWALAMRPLLHKPSYESLALGLLVGTPLLHSALVGNIQPAIVALLLYAPWPLAVAVAGTLKATPLVFALVEPRRLPPVLVLAGLLMSPLLWTGWEGYATDDMFWGLWRTSPIISIGLAVAGSGVTLMMRGPYRLLAAGATAILAAPFLIMSYLAYVLIALNPRATPRRQVRRSGYDIADLGPGRNR